MSKNNGDLLVKDLGHPLTILYNNIRNIKCFYVPYIRRQNIWKTISFIKNVLDKSYRV